MRSWLYVAARLLGDWRAVRSGRITARIWNRAVGRTVWAISRRLYK